LIAGQNRFSAFLNRDKETNMKTRNFLLGTLAAWLLAGNGYTADYPGKTVRIIVPWPAGGLVDLPARLIGERLSANLGKPFIVENKPGAGGTIGADVVAKAEPDGYTLMVTTSAININAAIQPKLPFDASKAFEPVSVVAYAPMILVTHPAKGPKSVQELIAQAKSNPGKLNYASAGNGTPGHFAGEMFKSRLGLDIVHVAYKGGPPAMVDQIAGLVDFHFANAAVGTPQVKNQKVTALAVTSSKRLASLPDVPTLAEAGVPGVEVDQWIAFLAPRGTPKAIVDQLNAQIGKALADREVSGTLERNGMVPAVAQRPDQFGAYFTQDLGKWSRAARDAHIQAE
jgi:tripartite-type tricarboxylate transporter receptor subunit TctC